MIDLAYRVVAVPERIEHARALADRLGADVVLDERHEGTFPNHLRALGSVQSGTHAVILEDDAILCPDFETHVARLVAELPDHLLGLYVGRSHPKRVQPAIERLTAVRPSWLDDPEVQSALRWAIGFVMPVADIPAVLDHLASGDQHPWINTDKRLGAWHAERGLLSYPFPSPVDHNDELPSTTVHGRSVRVAWQHCPGGAQ